MDRLEDWTPDAVPIDFVDKDDWAATAARLPAAVGAFAAASGFEAKPGGLFLAPAGDGALARVFFGVEAADVRGRDRFLPGRLATLLPPGLYRFAEGPADPFAGALAFLLSSYSFTRYVPAKSGTAATLRAGGRRSRAGRTHRGGGRVRARSREHARQ